MALASYLWRGGEQTGRAGTATRAQESTVPRRKENAIRPLELDLLYDYYVDMSRLANYTKRRFYEEISLGRRRAFGFVPWSGC